MNDASRTVYGLHAVRHAIEHAPRDILQCWIQANKRKVKSIQSIANLAKTNGINIKWVDKDTLEKITGDSVHQGIVIERRGNHSIKQLDMDTLILEANDGPLFVLVLDGIQDPHNLGACLRSANAAGVDAVIIPKDRAVQINATVSKVASGATEHTPVIAVTNLSRTLEKLQGAGVWVIGTSDDAEESIYTVDLKGSLALVMGGEGKGMRHNTRKHCDRLVHIPMAGQVESLNVSVATGVVVFEAMRQRQC
jgi:23S rRNA (guanosine2251-2'-O)-methyltransferase